MGTSTLRSPGIPDSQWIRVSPWRMGLPAGPPSVADFPLVLLMVAGLLARGRPLGIESYRATELRRYVDRVLTPRPRLVLSTDKARSRIRTIALVAREGWRSAPAVLGIDDGGPSPAPEVPAWYCCPPPRPRSASGALGGRPLLLLGLRIRGGERDSKLQR